MTSFDEATVTVNVKDADFPPQDAVIVEVPAATAVILPNPFTVATDVFEEVYVIFVSVASRGITVTDKSCFSPTVIVDS